MPVEEAAILTEFDAGFKNGEFGGLPNQTHIKKNLAGGFHLIGLDF